MFALDKEVKTFSSEATAHLENKNSTETEDLYPCNVCQKRFSNKDTLNKHWDSQHPDKSKTTCTLCHKTFSRELSLIQHTRAYLNILPFSCNLCEAVFTTSSNLHSHRRSKHREPFKCDYCEKEFSLAKTLNYHKKIHIANHFTCVKCKKIFVQKNYFLQHQLYNRCYKIESISCKTCKQTFQSEAALNNHINKRKKCNLNFPKNQANGKTDNEIEEVDLQDKKYDAINDSVFKCDLGECMKHGKSHSQKLKTSRRGRILKDVNYKNSDEREEKTENLDNTNSNNYDRNGTEQHDTNETKSVEPNQKRNIHKEEKSSVSSVYLCDYGSKSFTTKASLNQHKRIFKGNCKVAPRNLFRNESKEIYPCNDCSTLFKDYRDLTRHVSKCNPNQMKYPKCSKCKRSYTRYDTLMQHTRRHLKIHPYSCDICKKGFESNSRIHKHKKLGKCKDNINYESSNNEQEPKHIEVENSENKDNFRNKLKEIYPCNDCLAVFNKMEDLTMHVNKCNPKQLKAPKCYKCKRSYTRYETLMQHTRCHLKIYPYSCNFCQKGFTVNANVHKHKKSGKCKDNTSKNKKKPNHMEVENKSSKLYATDSTYSCDVCNKVFSDLGDCMKHEKTHSQILKTSRSGRAIKAVVSNTPESREGSSDKENLNGITNSNSDQNYDEEHLEENNEDVKVIETIEKSASPILEVVSNIKEIVGFRIRIVNF